MGMGNCVFFHMVLKDLFLIFCMNVRLYGSMDVMCIPGTFRNQKRVPYSLKRELQMIVSDHMGTEKGNPVSCKRCKNS